MFVGVCMASIKAKKLQTNEFFSLLLSLSIALIISQFFLSKNILCDFFLHQYVNRIHKLSFLPSYYAIIIDLILAATIFLFILYYCVTEYATEIFSHAQHYIYTLYLLYVCTTFTLFNFQCKNFSSPHFFFFFV